MSLEEKFNTAVRLLADTRSIRQRETFSQSNELHGFYMQATMGDLPEGSVRPGDVGSKAAEEWENWKSKRGLSADAAKEAYVAIVTDLVYQGLKQ